jgi:hypothetical protein
MIAIVGSVAVVVVVIVSVVVVDVGTNDTDEGMVVKSMAAIGP